MDIKDIQSKLKSGLVFLKDKFKETLKLPYAKLYLILSILVGIPLFVVLTFPYGVIIQKELQEYAKTNRSIQSIIPNEINVSLFSGIEIYGLTITMDDKEILINEIIVDSFLLPYQLLVSNSLDADIAINRFQYRTDTTNISFDLNSNIDFKIDKKTMAPTVGDVKMILSRAKIQIGEFNLPDSMMGLPLQFDPISIASINFDSNMTNKKLNIKTFKITGADLRGSIKGSITIRNIKRIMNSTIDLTISIDSKSKAISNNKLVRDNELIQDQLKQITDSSGNIVVKLTGTLGRPRPNLGSRSSGSPRNSSPDIIDRGSRKDTERDLRDVNEKRTSTRRSFRSKIDKRRSVTDKMKTIDEVRGGDR